MARLKSLKLPLRRPWIPYIIFIITLLITLFSTYYVNRTINTEDHLVFLNIVKDIDNNIETRILSYINLMRGSAGVFAINPDITATQFTEYLSRQRVQNNYPGEEGIGYAQRISGSDKDNFIQSVQSQEDPQFTISPPGDRPEYYVIRYNIFSYPTNLHIIGYDMFSDKVRRNAIEHARDIGKTTATQKVSMFNARDNKNEPGFLIFTPLYQGGNVPATIQERRDKIQGFVFSSFIMNNLMADLKNNKMLSQDINYKIYDNKNIDDKYLLYDSKINSASPRAFNPHFQMTDEIFINGEPWTIIYTSSKNFETKSQQNISTVIFITGILLSLIFFLLSRSQYMARTIAEINAEKLRISQKELQKALKHRDNFISIASHELKTPVTSLKVYAEVLLRRFGKTEDKKTTEYLLKMNRQIDKLTLLIQDLLDVSRIQRNQLTYRIERFDLNIMVQEVIENAQQLSIYHKITLKGSIRKKIRGDRERIGQVLINLLTNAIKYSPNANNVIVSLNQTKEEVVISVTDFGIGINKEHRKKIFDRFYRISDTNEQTFPGLGIGLFISQAIVKRHGGEITIRSEKGKGSTFSFNLPFKKLTSNF